MESTPGDLIATGRAARRALWAVSPFVNLLATKISFMNERVNIVERFGLAYYAIGRGRSIHTPKA
jgi:hypothetical protein